MKLGFKITLATFFCIIAKVTFAQYESYLQPLDNRLLINPTYAGLDNTTSYNTGNHYYNLTEDHMYNLYYATYDTYSQKLKGGVALFLLHGLIGERNISTNEIGFAYSGFPVKTDNGEIRFSFNTNFIFATKQWFVYSQDKIFLNSEENKSLPGQNYIRYFRIKPRLGFLYNTPSLKGGITATWPLTIPFHGINENDDNGFPAIITCNVSGIFNNLEGGLMSKPYTFIPELLLFYSNSFVFTRVKAVAAYTNKTLGVFLQNDFTNNIHCIGGTIGYCNDKIRVNLNTGIGIPGISEEVGYTWELSLRVAVPQYKSSKLTPWSGPQNKQ